jgi:hypothetical protein
MKEIRVLCVNETGLGGTILSGPVMTRLGIEIPYVKHDNPQDNVCYLPDFKEKVDSGKYQLVLILEMASRGDDSPRKPQFIFPHPINEHCANSLEMAEYAIQKGLKAIIWSDEKGVQEVAKNLGAKVINSKPDDLGTAALKAFRELYPD